jgi:hypothetical protein
MKILKIIGFLLIFSFIVSLFSGSSNSTSSSNTTVQTPVVEDTSWIPAGFDLYPNDANVAWRWGTSKETRCTYSSGSCWSAMIITKNGCSSSLYGEIAILDSAETQIDYTNDTASSVPPGQKVKLTFDSFNEQGRKARLTKLSCY